jgi:hypothetical protein
MMLRRFLHEMADYGSDNIMNTENGVSPENALYDLPGACVPEHAAVFCCEVEKLFDLLHVHGRELFVYYAFDTQYSSPPGSSPHLFFQFSPAASC